MTQDNKLRTPDDLTNQTLHSISITIHKLHKQQEKLIILKQTIAQSKEKKTKTNRKSFKFCDKTFTKTKQVKKIFSATTK